MSDFEGPLAINFVTDIDFKLLERQQVSDKRVQFFYSTSPAEDALNVIYGAQSDKYDGFDRRSAFFVVTEPPEIHRWRPRDLIGYRLVLGPYYSYLVTLSNFFPVYGIYPWRLGVAHELGRHAPTLTKTNLMSADFPNRNLVSTVMSLKSRTGLQRKRIQLCNFLEKKIDDFVVFGRDTNPVEDKFDALIAGRFHLAVENASHFGFFTEKLTDPLLVGNTVFYGGHPWSIPGLNPASIVSIDVENPRAVLDQIKRMRDEPQSEEEVSARAHNRFAVMATLNIHRQVIRAAECEGIIPGLASRL